MVKSLRTVMLFYLISAVSAVVGTFLLSFFGPAIAGKTRVEVSPLFSFDLRDGPTGEYWVADESVVKSTQIVEFVAHPTGLYFLLSTPGKQTIVRTTLGGAYVDAISTLRPGVRDFDVDNAGRIFVLHETGFDVYGPRGNLQRQMGVERYAAEFCLLDGYPLGVTKNGDVFYLAPKGEEQIAVAKGGLRLLLAAAGARAFVLVDGAEALVHLGHLDSGITKSSAPATPEVSQAKVNSRIVFGAAATDEAGGIYLSVLGHSVYEGYPVLRLDRDGVYKDTVYCSLPTFERFVHPKEPAGHMIVTRAGALQNQLFLIDSRGTAAIYPIDI